MLSIKIIKSKYHGWMLLLSILVFTLSACNKPPFNDFQKDQPKIKRPAYGTAIGAVVGSLFGATFIGAMVGGASMTALTMSETNREAVLRDLNKDNIQFVQYGDKCTLLVPTDRFYIFNSPDFNNICYKGLNDIIRLISFYPKSKFYVAGFTDEIGDPYKNVKLSKARAETMLTFLWAHNIPAEFLQAQGFGDRFSIGDNFLIRGSAYNRRIEIQWYAAKPEKPKLLPKGFKLDRKPSKDVYK